MGMSDLYQGRTQLSTRRVVSEEPGPWRIGGTYLLNEPYLAIFIILSIIASVGTNN